MNNLDRLVGKVIKKVTVNKRYYELTYTISFEDGDEISIQGNSQEFDVWLGIMEDNEMLYTGL
jgi:hypothetical protein